MKNSNKTKEQLIKKVNELEAKLAELEKSETERKQAEEELQERLHQLEIYRKSTRGREGRIIVSQLYGLIKNQLSTFIDTTNFFIALYNKETDAITLPYLVDKKDKFTSFPAGKTLTGYVIKKGEPLLATEKVMDKLVEAGEVELIGTPSKIWLGAPLKIEDKVTGVVVLQSYTDASLYSESDLEILQFVSGEIALAIERKKSIEQIEKDLIEKETMLREIHHRVKNNMQVIISLLDLESRYITDKKAKDIFKTTTNRVRSMALVHEHLYQAEYLSEVNFHSYLRTLVDELYLTYTGEERNINIKVEVPKIFLNIEKAVPLGLLTSELVTNALKYAFPDKGKGNVSVIMTKDKKNIISLKVIDDGIGLPEDVNLEDSPTFGLKLVNMLTKQIQGTLEVKRKVGTEFTIKFEAS